MDFRSLSPIVIGISLLLVLYSLPSFAGEKMAQGDPMVRITTMPTTIDLGETLARVSTDVSEETGLKESFVTYYWQFFEAIHCPGCKQAGVREVVFIDLYTPGFMDADDRRVFMKSLARALAANTDYDIRDIYLHTHIAGKDQLFIMGDVVTNWKQVGGPDDGGR